jgi:hypothetical protein
MCERLKKLGYESERHIKLYGEELLLVSNPIVEVDGFSIDGIAGKSGKLMRTRVPLSTVRMLEREFALQRWAVEETLEVAA